MFDKPLNRKHNVKFNPKQALDLIQQGPMPEYLDEEARKGLLQAYIDVSVLFMNVTRSSPAVLLQFKQLMLTIDPDEDEDEDGEGAASKKANANAFMAQLASQRQQSAVDESNGLPKPVITPAADGQQSSVSFLAP
jgi:cohesin loading factor subunit SCC2